MAQRAVRSAKTTPGRLQSVFPSLAYEDAERAVEWLAATFGFELILSVPGDGGGILHAELQTPEGDIVMVLSTQQSTRRSRSPRSLGGTAQSVYVASSDVDGLHQRAEEAGAEVFNPLHDTGHGREFCCLDPEGHIWTFGTYRPDAASASMSTRNKQSARAVFEIWSNGELDRLDEFVAPDVVHHDPYDPNGARGLEGMKRTIELNRRAFPDLRLTVEDQVADGDKVVTRWRGEMTHLGELGAAPPTGNRVTIAGITIDRFADGRIVEAWRSMDTLGLLRGIGALGSG